MATKNRIGKHTSIALVVIIMCFICILCCGVLSSCTPAEAAPSQQLAPKYIEIPGQRYLVKARSAAIAFFVIEFEGHRYAIDYAHQFFVHLASCPCHNEKSESSGLWETPPSSIFNW